MSSNRFFPKIKEWVSLYAPPGVEDQRAVHTFIDCETTEAQNSLRSELMSIANGHAASDSLDLTVGQARVSKHGSYQAWAKLMLQWMAGYKG